MTKKNENFFSEWLEKLQQESWQLELLISGFAIYGLFSFRDYLDKMGTQLVNFGEELSIFVLIFTLGILYTGTILFIINLLVHVIIRGLWIGAIGLRYVSGEIEYDKLKYNDRFLNFYKRKVGSFDRYIEKLEKFASVIFSYTFLLFFIFLSVFLFIAFLIIGMEFLSKFQENLSISSSTIAFELEPLSFFFLMMHLLFGGLVAFDFVTLGLLKRIKQRHFSFLYLWIYRYMGWITLSFLWRPLLLNFLDSKFTRILFFLAVPYGIVILIFLPSFVLIGSSYYPEFDHIKDMTKFSPVFNKHMYNPVFYDDELDKHTNHNNRIDFFSIPSKRVSGKLFEVFINRSNTDENLIPRKDSTLVKIRNKGLINRLFGDVGYESEEAEKKSADFYQARRAMDKERKKMIKESDQPEALLEQWKIENHAAKKAFKAQELLDYEANFTAIKKILQGSFQIKINNIPVDPQLLECDYFIHPNNEEKGMLCFFPLDSLRVGRHFLTVDKVKTLRDTETGYDTISNTIPFIYDGE